MSEEEDDKKQTMLHLRVQLPFIEALDDLGELLEADALATPGGKPTRADVARMAMAEGIRVMRAKLKGGAK
jgi:hypothetical protein